MLGFGPVSGVNLLPTLQWNPMFSSFEVYAAVPHSGGGISWLDPAYLLTQSVCDQLLDKGDVLTDANDGLACVFLLVICNVSQEFRISGPTEIVGDSQL